MALRYLTIGYVLLSFLPSLALGSCQLRERDPLAPKVPDARNRFALVIGMSGYSNIPQLAKVPEDVEQVTVALTRTNFEVDYCIDLPGDQIQSELIKFSNRLDKEDMALIYYAGHGVQIEGKNYLLPVDFNIVQRVDEQALELDQLLAIMARARPRLNVVIVDACRDGSLFSRGATEKKGLTIIRTGGQARSTLIAFSAAPGKVAKDGLYAKWFVQEIQKPGNLSEVFMRIHNGVLKESSRMQEPWVNSALSESFYFVPESQKAIDQLTSTELDQEITNGLLQAKSLITKVENTRRYLGSDTPLKPEIEAGYTNLIFLVRQADSVDAHYAISGRRSLLKQLRTAIASFQGAY